MPCSLSHSNSSKPLPSSLHRRARPASQLPSPVVQATQPSPAAQVKPSAAQSRRAAAPEQGTTTSPSQAVSPIWHAVKKPSSEPPLALPPLALPPAPLPPPPLSTLLAASSDEHAANNPARQRLEIPSNARHGLPPFGSRRLVFIHRVERRACGVRERRQASRLRRKGNEGIAMWSEGRKRMPAQHAAWADSGRAPVASRTQPGYCYWARPHALFCFRISMALRADR